ncbi:MAG: hypothetical protein ABIX01_00425 [Chitinophagaceae bacterium]
MFVLFVAPRAIKNVTIAGARLPLYLMAGMSFESFGVFSKRQGLCHLRQDRQLGKAGYGLSHLLQVSPNFIPSDQISNNETGALLIIAKKQPVNATKQPVIATTLPVIATSLPVIARRGSCPNEANSSTIGKHSTPYRYSSKNPIPSAKTSTYVERILVIDNSQVSTAGATIECRHNRK